MYLKRNTVMSNLAFFVNGVNFEIHGSPNESATINSSMGQSRRDKTQWFSAIDTLESIILAHYCAGVDVASMSYREGIATTIDAIINNYGDWQLTWNLYNDKCPLASGIWPEYDYRPNFYARTYWVV